MAFHVESLFVLAPIAFAIDVAIAGAAVLYGAFVAKKAVKKALDR